MNLAGILIPSLIGLGIFATLGYLIRGQGEIRTDIAVIKTTLGINGSKDSGLVPRVQELGERSHQHANDITILMAERELRIREAGL